MNQNKCFSAKVPIFFGPTGVGKSEWVLDWASRHPGYEILQVDSVTVYRGFEIGCTKPSFQERARIAHHLLDVRDPGQPYTAADFVKETKNVLQTLATQGKKALLTGGNAFYLRALLLGVWEVPGAHPGLREAWRALSTADLFEKLRAEDPAAALKVGPQDRYRLIRALEIIHQTGKTWSEQAAAHLQKVSSAGPSPYCLISLDRAQASLVWRIQQRTQAMLQSGLIEEYQRLAKTYPEAPALASIGYAQVRAYLAEQFPQGRKIPPGLMGLASEINLATLQLVKKQRTAFRHLLRQLEPLSLPFCRVLLDDPVQVKQLEETLESWKL